MGQPLQRWEIALIFGVTGFLIVVALLVASLDLPERREWHDPPPDEHDWVNLDQLGTTQVDLFFYETELNVTHVREVTMVLMVNTTNLTCRDGTGNVLAGTNITYADTDLDGRVSLGDRVHLRNMTDDHHGCRLQMEQNGTVFASTSIGWDRSDKLIYTLGFHWVYPALQNGSRWDTCSQVTHDRSEGRVPCENLSFRVLDEGGTEELTEATVCWNDTDGNGIVSKWDRVELYRMTDGYESASVRIIYEGCVIGIAELPNFIPRP